MTKGDDLAGSPGRRSPGNKAIWVGVYAELTELRLVFLVYLLAGAHHPEAFGVGARELSIMAFKGRLVIDRFMELTDASRTIRRMVRLYGVAIPLLLVLTEVFGPQIASLTSL